MIRTPLVCFQNKQFPLSLKMLKNTYILPHQSNPFYLAQHLKKHLLKPKFNSGMKNQRVLYTTKDQLEKSIFTTTMQHFNKLNQKLSN